MMDTSIVIAGFGGQGVLFAGKMLAYAGMESGYHVTWIPSYGPEMRGGTANCTVVIADRPIGAPIVAQPDILVALNLPSLEKYEHTVKPGGLIVINSSLISKRDDREDVESVRVPANLIAEAFDAPKLLNMVAVGALLARRPVVTLDAIRSAIAGHLPAHKADLVEINMAVMQRGFDAALPLSMAV
jgi:2-oxoglutarate ferredoxin oxidoreductase subunit gamma